MAALLEKKNNHDFLERMGLKAEEWKGFLDKGVSLDGKLTLKGTFRCDGVFKGEIDCDGLLILGESSQVEGEIHAKQLSVQGRVQGTVRADDKMVIMQNAVVSGEIFTRCLVIEAGAQFDGCSHMLKPEGMVEGTRSEEIVQEEQQAVLRQGPPYPQ